MLLSFHTRGFVLVGKIIIIITTIIILIEFIQSHTVITSKALAAGWISVQ